MVKSQKQTNQTEHTEAMLCFLLSTGSFFTGKILERMTKNKVLHTQKIISIHLKYNAWYIFIQPTKQKLCLLLRIYTAG